MSPPPTPWLTRSTTPPSSLGQMVGFDNVAALARAAGVTSARGTPSVSIGAYDATPLDMAGAYTIFANNGVHLNPWMLASVRNSNGDIVSDFSPEAKQVLDPRVAYLTQSLLEGAMNYGTPAGAVRGHGFTAPAAGKTGTSHDAWFAGYTSNLICIVWVGNDDYTDIKIEGAHAAAPIWTEFMKRAIQLPAVLRRQTLHLHPRASRLPTSTKPPISWSTPPVPTTASTSASSTAPRQSTPAARWARIQQNFMQKIFGIGGNKSVYAGRHPPACNASSRPRAYRSGSAQHPA